MEKENKANALCFLSALFLFLFWSFVCAFRLLVHIIYHKNWGVTKHIKKGKEAEDTVDHQEITQQAFLGSH